MPTPPALRVAIHGFGAGGRSAHTVFIGGHAPPGAGAWLPRPIDPLQVPREIDGLAARGGGRC